MCTRDEEGWLLCVGEIGLDGPLCPSNLLQALHWIIDLDMSHVIFELHCKGVVDKVHDTRPVFLKLVSSINQWIQGTSISFSKLSGWVV